MEESAPIDRKRLSYFQFIWTTFLLTSAGPFGFEYSVMAVGVGYTLFLVVLFAIFYALPISLISSELSGLMPARHGPIIWAYRAFYKLAPGVGDFVGYINAVNVVTFWIVQTSVLPIILVEYLTSITGSLSGITTYFIKLSVILSGLIINCFNFSIVAHITSFLCVAMCIPFLIAFLWTLPDINPSTQWRPCLVQNWALALTTCIYEYAGFESLANIVNEIKFDPKRLWSAYLIAVLADALGLLLPIIASATLTSTECSAWFDGFFAVSYAELSVALEYSVAIGSVIINWCIYVSCIGVVSRMLWATAQPYFEITSDGRMLTSMRHMMDTGTVCIAVNILPNKFIGELFERTGSAVYAAIVVTLFVALTNIYLGFSELIEFNLFTYFVPFGIECAAFLLLKHMEPNTERLFEVPFGKAGAWIIVVIVVLCMGASFVVMVIEDGTLFGVCVLLNLVFVCYYFISKKWCHRMYQKDIFPMYGFEDDDIDVKFEGSDDRFHEIQPLI